MHFETQLKCLDCDVHEGFITVYSLLGKNVSRGIQRFKMGPLITGSCLHIKHLVTFSAQLSLTACKCSFYMDNIFSLMPAAQIFRRTFHLERFEISESFTETNLRKCMRFLYNTVSFLTQCFHKSYPQASYLHNKSFSFPARQWLYSLPLLKSRPVEEKKKPVTGLQQEFQFTLSSKHTMGEPADSHVSYRK